MNRFFSTIDIWYGQSPFWDFISQSFRVEHDIFMDHGGTTLCSLGCVLFSDFTSLIEEVFIDESNVHKECVRNWGFFGSH